MVRLVASWTHLEAAMLTDAAFVANAQVRLSFAALCTVKALVTILTKKFYVEPAANSLLHVCRKQPEQCQGVLTG